MHPGTEAEWLSVKAIATKLDVSTTTVHKLVQSGELRAADVGTGKKASWRVHREDLENYLNGARAKTAARFSSAN
jgi:excisionase family DNA binding protein